MEQPDCIPTLERENEKKQIQTYLRLTGIKPGLLPNFGVPLMKDDILACDNGL